MLPWQIFLEFSNDSHQWNVNLLRTVHDWEFSGAYMFRGSFFFYK
jgi:hypothetical protein